MFAAHPSLFSGVLAAWNTTFTDLDGKELAKLAYHSLRVRWEITRAGRRIALVTGGRDTTDFAGLRFDTGKPTFRFIVDVPGPDDLVAIGSTDEHDYSLVRGERVVARVSTDWFGWDDSYGVDIVDGEDDILLLAVTVAIGLSAVRCW